MNRPEKEDTEPMRNGAKEIGIIILCGALLFVGGLGVGLMTSYRYEVGYLTKDGVPMFLTDRLNGNLYMRAVTGNDWILMTTMSTRRAATMPQE